MTMFFIALKWLYPYFILFGMKKGTFEGHYNLKCKKKKKKYLYNSFDMTSEFKFHYI